MLNLDFYLVQHDLSEGGSLGCLVNAKSNYFEFQGQLLQKLHNANSANAPTDQYTTIVCFLPGPFS